MKKTLQSGQQQVIHERNQFPMNVSIRDISYSVLMPVYENERPEHLRQSIQSMLDQTLRPGDFVLVEDGPLPEPLSAVIREFVEANSGLFNVIRLPEHRGMGAALKAGMEHCRNEFVARMDSDDVAFPYRIEKELGCILGTGADVVSGAILEFENNINNPMGARYVPLNDEDIRRYARRRSPFNHAATLFRKSAVLAAGGYKEDFPVDYDLWLRMLANGSKGANLNEAVLYVRTGNGQYARRGNAKYFRELMRFRWQAFRNGYCSLWDMLVVTVGQAGLCLAPVPLREKLYRRYLRK